MSMQLVFTTKWINVIQSRYSGKSEDHFYEIVMGADYDNLRTEVETYIHELPDQARRKLIKRFHDTTNAKQFFETFYELVVAHLLMKTLGSSLEYEKTYDCGTPDWTVKTANGGLYVVEVLTDNPSEGTQSLKRRWEEFLTRLSNTPVGVVVDIRASQSRWLSSTAIEDVSNRVRLWLQNQPPVNESIAVDGIIFAIRAWNPDCDHLIWRWNPSDSPEGFVTDNESLKDKFVKKLDKYNCLRESGIPFVVAVISDSETYKGYPDFKDAVLGKLTCNIGSFTVTETRANDGVFTEGSHAISAAMWVELSKKGWMGRIIQNQYAVVPLPSAVIQIINES